LILARCNHRSRWNAIDLAKEIQLHLDPRRIPSENHSLIGNFSEPETFERIAHLQAHHRWRLTRRSLTRNWLAGRRVRAVL
jgi:hypothetical protein